MTPADVDVLAEVARAFCTSAGLGYFGPAGHGAFKATYRVVGAGGKVVALKVYLPGSVSERAVREIEALTALSKTGHRSLPSFLAIVSFDHAGAQFLVSGEEFLGGGSLSERLMRGLCDRDDIVALARQLASALTVVAAEGLVHRDIKPDNLVFREDGSIVLVDFGLVRNLGQPSLTQTWLAQGPGTPLFAAPEQLNNDKGLIDWRTDQFSLGVSLSFSGFGRHPYAHPGDTPDRVVGRVGARERPHPDFLSWTAANRLAPIAKMVEPWAVSRFRKPAELVAAWSNP
ncbi:MAG: serine/threonine-protein kinase [Myxococcota bacterium]